MAGENTYNAGIYRKQGGNILVVDRAGRLALSTAGAGTLPTTGTLSANTSSATLVGNDFGGTITIVTTAGGTAANVVVFVVTFGTARTTAPIVYLANMTPGAAGVSTYAGTWAASSTTTTFSVQGLAAVTASSTYIIGYTVVDVE